MIRFASRAALWFRCFSYSGSIAFQSCKYFSTCWVGTFARSSFCVLAMVSYLSLLSHRWHSSPCPTPPSLPSSTPFLACHCQSNGCDDGQCERCLWQEVAEGKACDD